MPRGGLEEKMVSSRAGGVDGHGGQWLGYLREGWDGESRRGLETGRPLKRAEYKK
jgi:hypothetical protein